MIEVEIKTAIESIEGIVDKLIDIGFIKGTTVYEEDTYYNAVDRDFRRTDEALRIRRHLDLDTKEETYILNYKDKRIDDITMARDEFQTRVQSFEIMDTILIKLGYMPYSGVIKTRIHYRYNEVVACLDRVESLGDFLELEVMARDETEYSRGLAIIEDILAKLNLSIENTIRKSYLNMIEEGYQPDT